MSKTLKGNCKINIGFRLRISHLVSIFTLFFIASCSRDPNWKEVPQKPNGATPYSLKLPSYFPPMPVPTDNPLTVEGVALGRRLFYEPLLSGNNTQSCASCHQQSSSFAHGGVRFSKGIDGFEGFRNAMPLMNLAWSGRINWDGKFSALEEQVPVPIFLQFEMHENLDNAIRELRQHPDYPQYFKAAFGSDDVTVDRIAKSISQFMRTLVAGSPKIVQGIGDQLRTAQEKRGFLVFLDENKGDCFHCHEVNVFATNFRFVNNGLNADPTGDPGLYGQTGNPADIGKFKTPSLLNLKYTAPYMHDGRFSTLDEVIDFYDSGFHDYPSLDPNLKKHLDANGKPKPRNWTQQDKEDLKAFILSLEDTSFIRNPQFSKPD